MPIPKVSHLIPSILAVLLATAAVPSEAHHSFAAEYDSAKPVTVTGVVTRIEWTNPHAYIYVDVTDFKITRGAAKGDPAAQIAKLHAHEASDGAIIFRSGSKLYIVDAKPPQ